MGYLEADFWRNTPRQIIRQMKARQRQLRDEHNARAWIAWTTAALTRAKKMPKLERLMVKDHSRRRQTAAEQYEIVKAWNAALGGTTSKMAH